MLNRVVLMGRLTAIPELKTTTTGKSVTSFSVAVDRNYVKAGKERRQIFSTLSAGIIQQNLSAAILPKAVLLLLKENCKVVHIKQMTVITGI